MGHGSLILIDEEEKTKAKSIVKSFANKDVRNRAYFNILGVQLILKYLSLEGIDVSGVSGLHSIRKILEEIDVSDISLPNIRIDVRIIFDENIIFIPKSHFEYEITPDIYVVMKIAGDFSSVEILGFFEPRLINKHNENQDYYFLEKEKLSSCYDLINYIKSFSGSKDPELSNEELDVFEQMIVEISDNDIIDEAKRYLVKYLVSSPKLRKRFVDFEKFENLSYKAITNPQVDIPAILKDTETIDEFEIFNAENTQENEDSTEDVINLDTVDTVEQHTDEEISQEENESSNTEEVLSLDDVKEEEENNQIEENIEEDNVISFDNVEEVTAEESININNEEDVLSLENIESSEPENNQENESEEDSEDNLADAENIDETVDNSEESNEEVKLGGETFGRNLLENLNAESLDDIIIEGVDDDESVADESEDLFSKLEDVLSSSANADPEYVEPEDIDTENIDNLEYVENDIDDEENIINIDNVEEIPDVEEVINIDDSENIPNIDENNIEIIPNVEDIDTTEEIPNVVNVDNLEEITSVENIDNIVNIEDIDLNGTYSGENNQAEYSKDSEQNDSVDEADSGDNPDDKLDVLYNEDNTSELENISEENIDISPDQNVNKAKTVNKKQLITAAILVTILFGISLSILFKPKEAKQIADVDTIANNDPIVKTETEPVKDDNVISENVLESNIPSDIITEKKQVVKNTTPKEIKNTVNTNKTTGTYMSVSKLVWDVSDKASANSKMQSYLRTTGKSIKLSLSTDLLLANEYAYTNLVKVNIKINPGGNAETSILSSSGSTEIDNIVLQSVNDTLNVLKPAPDVFNGQTQNLTLIIYF